MHKKVYNIHWMICMSIWLIVTFGCLLSFVVDNEKVENMLYAFIILFVLFILFGAKKFTNRSLNKFFIFIYT